MARNMSQWGFGWQIRRFKASNSRMTTYVRNYESGERDSVDLVGMLGNRRYQSNATDGSMKIESSDLDVVYKLEDLTFDGLNVIKPDRGDQILLEREDGSAVDVFDVTPLGYEGTHRIDPDRTRVIVHTKLARTEEYFA